VGHTVVMARYLWWWVGISKKTRGGEGGRTVVVITRRYLWWGVGISKKNGGRGRGDILSSLHIVTCGGRWGLVKRMWGRGYIPLSCQRLAYGGVGWGLVIIIKAGVGDIPTPSLSSPSLLSPCPSLSSLPPLLSSLLSSSSSSRRCCWWQ
jgi:hypothetical protein